MPTDAGGSRQQSGRVVRCTSTSGAGGRGLFGAGAVAAAVAVRRGGMAHAAKAARQQPANERARLRPGLDMCAVARLFRFLVFARHHADLLGGTQVIANFHGWIYLGRKKRVIVISRIPRNAQFEPVFCEMKNMPVGSRIQTASILQ